PTPDVKAPEVRPPEVKTFDVKAPSETKAPETKVSELRGREIPTQPPIPRTGPTKIDELLELAGVRAQLVGLLSRVAVDLRPPPGQMSPADQAIIARMLALFLRQETVFSAVRDAFRTLSDSPSTDTTAAELRTAVA